MHISKNKLQAVLLAASKDETRHNINGVRVEGDKLVATDGHRLHIVNADVDGSHDPVTITRSSAQTLIKRLPAKGSTATSDGLKWDSEEGTTKTQTLEDEFPNYQLVMPKGEPKVAVFIDARYLKDAAEAAIKASGTNGKQVLVDLEIRDELEAITIKSDHFQALIMPARK